MELSKPSCAVALPRERNNATAKNSATNDATANAANSLKPASLLELRAQLRAQLVRNQDNNREAEKVVELRMPESATATFWGWLIHYPDRDPVEAYVIPEPTHGEVLRDFPGAIAAEPIPATPKRKATFTESRELTGLVNLLYSNDTEADRAEAILAALADPDDALICYRAIRGALKN